MRFPALRLLLLCSLLSPASGCLLTGKGTHARLDHGARLIAHPQFKAAAQAAPDWTRDALNTIADLESEIERR